MIEKIPHLERNDELKDLFCIRNAVYSTETGEELVMKLVLPWSLVYKQRKDEKRPLIVFVQGSAWQTADFNRQLPQFTDFARAGFVIASVRHRNCALGHPFPAFLQDVKCAIRYLRRNADEYGIDPEHVCIWGTSSGGNTAMLVGATADDERYETTEHAGFSDSVNAVISCFGPSDMVVLSAPLIHTPEGQMIGAALCGSPDLDIFNATAVEMSPTSHITAGRTYPPYLILNGTADPVVPHAQLEIIYEKLTECGVHTEAYYVDGAEHEENFWSREVLDIILDFAKKNT